MSIVARFFPNGEFTQGVDTSLGKKQRKHKQRKHEQLTQECRDGYLQWFREEPNADTHLCVPGQQFVDADGGLWTYLCEDTNGHHYAYASEKCVLADVLMNEPIGRLIGSGRFTPITDSTPEDVLEALVPLGLSNGRILTNAPSRKKCERMTSHMGRNIRNAAYILERDYGKDCLSFLTLTLPDLTPQDMASCVANWDRLIHRFLKWLRTKVNKHFMELKYVYCTEIQTKRLEQKHEYAPHLHLLFRGRYGKKSAWAITPRMARQEWVRCLKSVCSGSFNQSALENLQRIKRSAGGYLSKYMSKTANCLPSGDGQSPVVATLHTHWGGMSRNLARAIRGETYTLRQDGGYGDIAAAFVGGLPHLLKRGCFKYLRYGTIRLFYNGDDRDTRYLKVAVGCLQKPLSAGGYEGMVKELLRIVEEGAKGVRQDGVVSPYGDFDMFWFLARLIIIADT